MAQSHAVNLFEKAQGGIAMLAQIDGQIGQLLAQRREVQTDLTAVQAKINEEFARLMRESDELPAKVLAEISGGSAAMPEPTPAPESRKRGNVAAAETAEA